MQILKREQCIGNFAPSIEKYRRVFKWVFQRHEFSRHRDIKDGKSGQLISNALDNKLREDLERMKKIRCHRGLRHFWGLRVRGQHTKTTGRRGRTVGVSKKK